MLESDGNPVLLAQGKPSAVAEEQPYVEPEPEPVEPWVPDPTPIPPPQDPPPAEPEPPAPSQPAPAAPQGPDPAPSESGSSSEGSGAIAVVQPPLRPAPPVEFSTPELINTARDLVLTRLAEIRGLTSALRAVGKGIGRTLSNPILPYAEQALNPENYASMRSAVEALRQERNGGAGGGINQRNLNAIMQEIESQGK